MSVFRVKLDELTKEKAARVIGKSLKREIDGIYRYHKETFGEAQKKAYGKLLLRLKRDGMKFVKVDAEGFSVYRN